MAVAIRAITRIQDGDDAPALGAGQDGYALTWNNATSAFVATALPAAGVTDHGALTGLSDDDHTGYALLAGRAGGQTLYGGTAANDDITIHGTSNATRTTSYVLLQPTAGYVGIGTTAPGAALDVFASTASVLFVGSVGTAVLKLYSTGTDNPNLQVGITGIGSTPYATLQAVDDGAYRAIVLNPTYGSVGINRTDPATKLHIHEKVGQANAVDDVLTLSKSTGGTVANGLGAGLIFNLESSTAEDQSAARIQALWNDATHATRKADLVLTAYDASAEREGLRIRGAGSEPAIGFYGVTPIARAVLATGAGATVDNVITALQNLGLVKQS